MTHPGDLAAILCHALFDVILEALWHVFGELLHALVHLRHPLDHLRNSRERVIIVGINAYGGASSYLISIINIVSLYRRL